MTDQYIHNGETDNVLPANATVVSTVSGEFVVKVWSATGAYDSGTVSIYLLAPDDTPILLQAFTENGAYFGRVGTDERITAGISGVAAAAADISVTITEGQ